jgi:hypothetical protein
MRQGDTETGRDGDISSPCLPVSLSPCRLVSRHQWIAILLLALLVLGGLLARVWIAKVAVGTNDAYTFIQFGVGLNREGGGLIEMYKQAPDFNHPPLVGYWIGYVSWKAGKGDGLLFTFLFKLPMIAADALAAWMLYDIWRPKRGHVFGLLAAAAFAWSIDSILVTAFHCNTDSLYAVLVLLSAYLVERRRLHFLGGIALGAAINVKLIPVLLVAPMLLSYRSWRDFFWFSGGLALGIVPFLPVLFDAWSAFHRNAIAYNSNVCLWGINQFLLEWRDRGGLNAEHRAMAQNIIDGYGHLGRYLILGGAALVGLVNHFRARWDRYQLCAICLGLFLVLTPGFGVQYSVMVVPVLMAVSVGRGFVYSTLAGIFIGIVYYGFWDGSPYYYSNFTGPFPQPAPLFGLLAWGVLAAGLAKVIASRRESSAVLPG